MSDSGNAEFDRYAKEYTDLHKASISSSGEEPSYFSRYKATYMAEWLRRHASKTPSTVLDFGCGIGNSISHLRFVFPSAQLCGVDPSSDSIQIAISTHSGAATFLVGNDRELPYADDSFDLVQVACVFHHIQPGRRAHWLEEIRRVLRPGGHLFVFEHNLLNPLTVKAVHDCPFDEDAILLPKRELLNLANQSGFVDICARYIVFFPKALGCFRPMEPYLGMVPLGAQYVVHAVA